MHGKGYRKAPRTQKSPARPPAPQPRRDGRGRAPMPGCRRLGAGTWAQPQTVIGFDIVSTAIDMRADSGAKDASNSFSEASCSFAVSDIVRSMAARV